MDYQGFISTVQRLADISRVDAERASRSTLKALAARISEGEAADIVQRVPEELRSSMEHEGERENFHVDDFLGHLEEELGVVRPTAEQEARAVLAALWSALGPREFADLRAELPRDFEPLLEDAAAIAPPSQLDEDLPMSGRLPLEDFLLRITERTGVDREHALRATRAVLEALALRVTGGQVEDLIPRVPRELRRALRHGEVRTHGRALRLSLEAFIREIAKLEHGSRADAWRDARAVFAALREAVGEKEFHDTTAQLPDEYVVLFQQLARA
jgi:uncharacterized protein (DUF2267 family)